MELDLDQVGRWLSQKQAQLAQARHVFSGREISAVMVDPVGLKFPRFFYPFLLRYQAGHGLVPHRRNPQYMGSERQISEACRAADAFVKGWAA